ncbi:hypothetical protein JCM21900_004948 [Sporobolomyces salmonicolor]
MSDASKETTWQPPTPHSGHVSRSEPNLPVDHLVLLPPPLISPCDDARRFAAHPVAPAPHPAHSHPSPASPAEPAPGSDWASVYTKRPRRSAALVAARNIPRHPSPFELESDDGSVSPPPPASSTARAGASGSSFAPSKRKVSHSLIERRRREKINECLATLRETVPNLREEGERKLARAKERGRKRGKGDEAGERGGLHKLEILQGTIEYLEALRAHISALEAQRPASAAQLPSHPTPSQTRSAPPGSSSRTASRAPSPVAVGSKGSAPTAALPSGLPSPLISPHSAESTSTSTSEPQDDADRAASMLLYFSTSPELRPVQV